jgi:hypothetical protein
MEGTRDRLELIVVSIPGRDDNDPASWYVMDRATRRQIGDAHPTYNAARAAVRASRSRNVFVIVREDGSQPLYFLRLGLGIFWECSHNVGEARHFTTRAAASRVLTTNGKHRQGWRVVAEQVPS